MKHPQVLAPALCTLCALGLFSGARLATAQPAEPPRVTNPINTAPFARPPALPILPLKLEEWLASRGGATTLKLKMDGAIAADIAEEVQRQTGLPTEASRNMVGGGIKDQLFSVEATGQPFWQAVREWNRSDKNRLAVAAMVGPRIDAPLRLALSPPASGGRGLAAGPVYLVASSINTSRSRTGAIDAPTPGQSLKAETLRIEGEMYIDPRFAPEVAAMLVEVESARDDVGHALGRDKSRDSQPPTGWNHWNPTRFVLETEAPPEGARQLASLRGVVRLAVVARRAKWEFDPRAAPRQEKIFASDGGDIAFRFEGISGNGRGGAANFVMQRPTIAARRVFAGQEKSPFPSPLGDTLEILRSIRFLNAAGQQIPPSGGGGGNAVGEGIGMEARFSSFAEDLENLAAVGVAGTVNVEKNTPAKIVVDMPLEWREVQIPFEFKDLPLP